MQSGRYHIRRHIAGLPEGENVQINAHRFCKYGNIFLNLSVLATVCRMRGMDNGDTINF